MTEQNMDLGGVVVATTLAFSAGRVSRAVASPDTAKKADIVKAPEAQVAPKPVTAVSRPAGDAQHPASSAEVQEAASACGVPARLRWAQSGMLRCGPPETARAPGGTSRRTTVPAPVAAPSPISTGATNVLLEEVRACRPTLVRCFCTPS